jgi:hypothetical protein
MTSLPVEVNDPSHLVSYFVGHQVLPDGFLNLLKRLRRKEERDENL